MIFNDTGKGYYRLKQPYSLLSRHCPDFDIQMVMRGHLAGSEAENLINDCDVYLLQNIHSRFPDAFPNLMKYAISKNKAIIYDVDDLDWKLSRENPAYEEYTKHNIGKYLIKCLKLATATTTTTPRLANEIREFTKNVYVIPNAIDYDYYYWNLPKKDDGFVRIGFNGGASHYYDLKLVEGIGKWIIEEFDNTKFVLGGYDSRMLNPNPNLLLYSDGPDNVWTQYKEVLFGNNYDLNRIDILRTEQVDSYPMLYKDVDILIAPLKNNKFNQSKSELKLIESSAYSIPVIASDVGVYSTAITSAINGFLVRTPGDWKKYLKKLIENKELRQRMGRRLKEDYMKLYDIYKINEKRINLIKKVYKETQMKAALQEVNKKVKEKIK